ncbi:hypothetical protein [Streptomyces noursei]|uniref:hypothetical protein n=1 Tax=Streptomyces noursei TaxID=1971 RepID=UPI0023B776E0|nr:hypothetical protein [Streptomyces noursei]
MMRLLPTSTPRPRTRRHRPLTRATAASAIGATIALTGLASAAPAQAAGNECRVTTKSFALPGKPDVTVSASVCMRYVGSWSGYRHYRAWLGRVEWTGDAWFIGGRRFNDFSFDIRAHSGSKSVGTSTVQDLSGAMNAYNDGARAFSSTGYGAVTFATKSKYWYATATANVDITDDGLPGRDWRLNATGTIT